MKKTDYTINYAEKEIIITKKFERRAGIYGSEAYNILKGLRSDLPDYTVKQKEIAKSSAKKTYYNLNYANMELYITVTDGADSENLKAFETIKKASKIQPSPYAFVKKWFLAEYPNYTDPTELIEKAA